MIPIESSLLAGSGRLIRLITDELCVLSNVVVLAARLLRLTLLKFLMLALALLAVRPTLTLLRLRLLAMTFFLARAPALATEALMELV